MSPHDRMLDGGRLLENCRYIGLRALRDHDFRKAQDCWLVERLREAGFVILGRPNAPELACAATTESIAYGRTRNPWSLDHSTGGSSGGSAAAVAAGLVPVAHGGPRGLPPGGLRLPEPIVEARGLPVFRTVDRPRQRRHHVRVAARDEPGAARVPGREPLVGFPFVAEPAGRVPILAQPHLRRDVRRPDHHHLVLVARHLV
ncbi:MAG: hypothetical protein GY910_15670 [bacterium]|nr:hypothetical protein [Deltaproteobacteria bacterium]MCP4906413.1 hypothetical protein [bacterium]